MRERGQAFIECALLVPLLMLAVIGATDFGRLYFSYVSITNAAQDGAHYASSSETSASDVDGIREAALAGTAGLPNSSPSNPDVSVATGTDSQERLYADVTVNYKFSTLFPWPGIPGEINLGRTVRAEVMQ